MSADAGPRSAKCSSGRAPRATPNCSSATARPAGSRSKATTIARRTTRPLSAAAPTTPPPPLPSSGRAADPDLQALGGHPTTSPSLRVRQAKGVSNGPSTARQGPLKRVLVALMLAGSMVSTGVHEATASHDLGCPDAITETFGPTAHAACRVAFCESTWRAWVYGGAGGRYVGLFQIGLQHGWGASTDPWTNSAYAFQLSRGGVDWTAWSCKP